MIDTIRDEMKEMWTSKQSRPPREVMSDLICLLANQTQRRVANNVEVMFIWIGNTTKLKLIYMVWVNAIKQLFTIHFKNHMRETHLQDPKDCCK